MVKWSRFLPYNWLKSEITANFRYFANLKAFSLFFLLLFVFILFMKDEPYFLHRPIKNETELKSSCVEASNIEFGVIMANNEYSIYSEVVGLRQL